MAFDKDKQLVQCDAINDYIWRSLNRGEANQLGLLNSKAVSFEKITKEIKTGCSPCPDIITSHFGEKPSVMFVSTVYGLINKYLNKQYNREEQDWNVFCEDFYKNIIQSGTGIYKRLDEVYELLSDLFGGGLEFCFTELVKTVLVDENNSVSGLGSKGSFLKYFETVEYHLLKERLTQIKKQCFIFSFSEDVTYFLLKALSQHTSFKEDFEIIHSDNKPVTISTRKKRNGDSEFSILAGNSFSSSVAFKTIFKLKNKDIYIIPLPHPSTSNNRYWPKNDWREELEETLKTAFTLRKAID